MKVFGSSLSSFTWIVAALTTTVVAANEGPPCNSVIGTVSVTEIQNVVGGMVQILSEDFQGPDGFNQTELLQALPVYLSAVEHNVLVSKVCGSCADYLEMMNGTGSMDWMGYCGDGVYGADATHSALVFHPIDAATGAPLSGKRNGLVSFQGTRFETKWAYSTHFPSNVTERIATTILQGNTLGFFTSFIDTIPMLLAASSGLIAIGPDYIGTGASIDYDRSYLTAMPVQQVAVVSWYAAQAYTADVTSGCTLLGSKAVTTGYSLGGAAVVFATIALEGVGVNITRMFTQAGPYSNTFVPQGVVARVLAAPDNFTLVGPEITVWTSFAAAYSNEAPFLTNTGTGQTILAEEYINPVNDSSKDVLGWFFDQKVSAAEIYNLYPADKFGFLSAINPAVLDAIIASLGTPGALFCQPQFQTNETNALCAALELNSPYTVWSVANSYPIEWCHSTADQLVPYLLTEFFLLPFQKPNVVKYEPVYEFMEPFGDHGEAQIACNAAFPTFLMDTMASTGYLSVLPIEEDTMGGLCPGYAAMPTVGPTMSPTMSEPEEDEEPTSSPSSQPSIDSWAIPTSVVGTFVTMLTATVWFVI